MGMKVSQLARRARRLLGLPVVAAVFLAAPAQASVPREAADQVSEARLRALVEKLVSFGTRHTLSSQTDPKRGIGAALSWTESELRRYSRACGGCLRVERQSGMAVARRIPTPIKITNIIAVQRGTTDPNRVVIITGHIDSMVTDAMNVAADSPGANDDGSGTAAVIEAARILSKYRFPATIVYGALMGEEQGLLGGKILADFAKAQGWEVVANLNNDIIGSSCGSDGKCDADHVRVFSEGPRWQGREALAAQLRRLGGENDAPSRNLSRWLGSLADTLSLGLKVRQVWRNDRYSRGGDHTEFLNNGFPAVRLTVAIENYYWQHEDVRTENGIEYGDTVDKMDFPYLRKVTQLNVAALAALALAPAPPAPAVEGAISNDTTISWDKVPGAASYIVRWRATNAADWEYSRRIAATAHGPNKAVLIGTRVDDWTFGVSSVSAEGHESPVASAVPGGAFRPYVPPPGQAQ